MFGSQSSLFGILFSIGLLLVLVAVSTGILATTMSKQVEVAADARGLAQKEQTAAALGRLRQLLERRDWLERQLALFPDTFTALENDRKRMFARLETLRKTEKLHNVEAQRKRKELKEEIELIKLDNKELESKIETVMREIKAIEEGATVVSSLVPGGAQRKALFIECDDKGVLLMPGATRLATGQAREVKDTVLEAASGKEQVMFLIRPDGFEAFFAFRKTIQKAGLAYGYQPVDQDWTLVYPSD